MKTVMITAIGSFAAEAAIKSLKQAGLRVVGCDIYPAEWVVNSGEADCFYQAPYATKPEEYLAFIEDVSNRESVDALLPLTDLEIDVLSDSRIREKGRPVLLISDVRTIDVCRDKRLTEQFLTPLHICSTIPGQRLADVDPEMLVYPVVLKPSNGRSSQGVRTIYSQSEMEFVKAECLAAGKSATNPTKAVPSEYLVQQQITGSIVTVDVVRNPDTEQTVCIPRKELLRTGNGSGTSVYLYSDKVLEAQCRDIAKALNIRGCVNFEFIEAGSGDYYFLECNPRFSGGLPFTCLAGYDIVKNHLSCFTGQELEKWAGCSPRYLARRYAEYEMKVKERTDE